VSRVVLPSLVSRQIQLTRAFLSLGIAVLPETGEEDIEIPEEDVENDE
jgi:hypothetical protein